MAYRIVFIGIYYKQRKYRSKSDDMYDALSNIKNLMQQNCALDNNQNNTSNRKVKGALDMFQATKRQLPFTLQKTLSLT